MIIRKYIPSEANGEFLAGLTVKAVRAIADGRGKKTVVERKNIKIQKKLET